MAALVSTREAVEKLCAFLQASSASAQGGDSVEDLFTPHRESRVYSVDVEVAFLVSPPSHRVPLYFTVPHEVMTGTICVITPPPQRSFKDKVLTMCEDGDEVAQRVKRVMDSKKLSSKVADPVAVRAFAKSYDNFVVYGLPSYPKQLSGEFLGHTKLPVWVPKKGSFEAALRRATKTVVVSRRGQNAVTCRIAHTGLDADQIVENVTSFVEQFTHHPQGTKLRHVLHIRVAGTNAEGKRAGLPIFSHAFQLERETAEEEEEAPTKKAKKE